MTFLTVQNAGEPLVSSPTNGRMQRTSSCKSIKGRLVGAGLLCYSVDPIYSCVYFLLGKERHNIRWPTGSNQWTDFGGRTAPNDTCAEDTAAREFFEETLAVVQYFEDDPIPRTGWHDIANDLRNGHYTLRLTQGNNVRKFVLFVKQIPWDPVVVSRFSTCRTALMQRIENDTTWKNHPALHRSMTGLAIIRREFMEKKVLGLWSVPQLRRAVDHNGTMTRRSGCIEHCRRSFVRTLEIIFGELAFQEPSLLSE